MVSPTQRDGSATPHVSRTGSSIRLALAGISLAVLSAFLNLVDIGLQLNWFPRGFGLGFWFDAGATMAAFECRMFMPATALGVLSVCLWGDRTGWNVGKIALSATALWRAIDAHLWGITGLHLDSYLTFADEPVAFEWSGGALQALVVLLGIGFAAACIAWLGVALVHAIPGKDRSALMLASLCVVFIGAGMAVFPVMVASRVDRSMAVFQISEALPIADGLSDAVALAQRKKMPAFMRLVNKYLDTASPQLEERVNRPHPPEREISLGVSPLPHVVIIVVESFRYDSIDPRWMPRVAEAAERAIVLERHYSAGNRSEFGLFGILYGRSALSYEAVLAAGMPAQLPVTLRENGYLSALHFSCELEWQGMERFLSVINFERRYSNADGEWRERDLRSLDQTVDALGLADRVFSYTFLVTTHYPFYYSPEYERHTPAASLDLDGKESMFARRTFDAELQRKWLNRYRNVLGSLDDMLGDFLDRVRDEPVLVVITGDHGESFYDDGRWLHGSRLSDAQIRVPCIILGPGVQPGRIDGATSHADLVPTILHLLGGSPVGLEHGHGRDLLQEGWQDTGLPFMMDRRNFALFRSEGRCKLKFDTARRRYGMWGLIDASANYLPFDKTESASAEYWIGEVMDEFSRMGMP